MCRRHKQLNIWFWFAIQIFVTFLWGSSVPEMSVDSTIPVRLRGRMGTYVPRMSSIFCSEPALTNSRAMNNLLGHDSTSYICGVDMHTMKRSWGTKADDNSSGRYTIDVVIILLCKVQVHKHIQITSRTTLARANSSSQVFINRPRRYADARAFSWWPLLAACI